MHMSVCGRVWMGEGRERERWGEVERERKEGVSKEYKLKIKVYHEMELKEHACIWKMSWTLQCFWMIPAS